jgi:hypothetical protein
VYETPDALRKRRARLGRDAVYDRRRDHTVPLEKDPMSASPLLVGTTIRAAGAPRSPVETAWEMLGGAATTLCFLALVDLLLLLFPMHLGDAHWEFDAVTAFLGDMPLLFVGLLLGYASAYARERAGVLRVWSLLSLGTSLVLAVAFTDYLLRIPVALAAADASAAHVEVVKGIIRTVCQGLAYTVALGWLGIRGWIQAAHT